MNRSIISILSVGILLSGCTKSEQTYTTQELETFGTCLTEKGAVFYGTTTCRFCNQQKAILGDGMKKVSFINCEENTLACTGKGITGYPTWIFADGSTAGGLQTIEQLSTKTQCPLP